MFDFIPSKLNEAIELINKNKRTLSLCITTFNRFEITIESFAQVADDDRISEIIIVDDCSDLEIYKKLETAVSLCPKVRLFRNLFNRDCYQNKMTAISYANNDWVMIIDSDNVIDKSYLDRIYEIPEWDSKTSYMPSMAAPNFDYRDYEGVTFTKENIAEFIDKPMVETCCNCMNYFVNRDEYLKVWIGDINPHTYDSLYQNYNWFAAGNKMYIVPNLSYSHVIHNQSHYRLNVHKSGNLREEILNKIRQLK